MDVGLPLFQQQSDPARGHGTLIRRWCAPLAIRLRVLLLSIRFGRMVGLVKWEVSHFGGGGGLVVGGAARAFYNVTSGS